MPHSVQLAGELWPTTEAHWYALQVHAKLEKKTDTLLQRKGVQTFLPLLHELHRWSDRQQQVAVPLFPGYDFVHLLLTSVTRKTVLQTAGVIAFVGNQHEPTPIPSCQIQALQILLHAETRCAIRPFLHTGQRVRIRDGALDGLVGILLEDTHKNLVISIDGIQRSLSIAIDGYDLEIL